METWRIREAARQAAEQSRHTPLRRAAGVWIVAALIIAFVVLSACGGGNAAGSAGGGNSQATSAPSLSAAQLEAAEKAYAGAPRTPADFLSDPPPLGVTGFVSTAHVRNSDLAIVVSTRFELCSDDVAQAMAWSETETRGLPVYADVVESNTTTQLFEFVRVPRNDSSARIRQRVFRCSYIDRSNSDLNADNGSAGTVALQPFAAADLKNLAEYLWQFTWFNNADFVVLHSWAQSGASNLLEHAIDMARLVHGATAADCDHIDLLRWTHTLNTATGALQRRLDTLSSYGVRMTNGSVQACSP